MARFSVFIVWFAVLFLTGCSSGNGIEWHQKLTVRVEIDGKEYVGSSVTSVKVVEAGVVAYESRGRSTRESMGGEAVVIDLGPHGYLFALWPDHIAGNYARMLKERRIVSNSDYDDRVRADKRYYKELKKIKETLVLDPGNYPTRDGNYPRLVAFKDLGNPRSIKVFEDRVFLESKNKEWPIFNPRSLSDFYDGNIRIKSIEFEITDEPLTVGVVESILSDQFFESWRRETKKFGFAPDCIRKTKLRHFCVMNNKGAWVYNYLGESR